MCSLDSSFLLIRVLLVDLGLMSVQGEEDVFAGTPGYVAPEWCLSNGNFKDSAKVESNIDTFALGATIFELIVGRLPVMRLKDPRTADPIGGAFVEYEITYCQIEIPPFA